MKAGLLSLIVLGSLLLAACGGDNARQSPRPTTAPTSVPEISATVVPTTAREPAATAGATLEAAAPATTGAEETTVPSPATEPTAGATAEVAALAPPEAVGTGAASTAEATAMAGQPTISAEAAKGGDPTSPLAIPRESLEKLGLMYIGGVEPNPAQTALLKRQNGEQLFQNVWQKSPSDLLSGVYDARYQFKTTRGARAFLREIRRALATELTGDSGNVKELEDSPKLGEETTAYLVTGPAAFPVKLYYVVFRHDRVVSIIAVSGNNYSKAQAYDLARQGAERVDQATR